MNRNEGRHGDGAATPEAARSSGRRRHSAGRGRALKTTIVALVVFDLFVGLISPRNIEHSEVAEMRRSAAELADAGGRTLLLLGGTAARADIDPARLSQSLRSGWTVAATPLEASTVAVWSAAYDQHFLRAGRSPNVVVIAFVNDELEDQNRIDWATIGNLHTSRGSLSDRWEEAPDLNAKLDVTASWASATVGNRGWLFDLVSAAIPNHSAVPRVSSGGTDEPHTFAILSDLIAQIRGNDAAVAVLALPTQRSYPLPDELQAAIQASGGVLIDLRLEGELSEDQFLSSASLTSAAAADFSELLAAELDAWIG